MADGAGRGVAAGRGRLTLREATLPVGAMRRGWRPAARR